MNIRLSGRTLPIIAGAEKEVFYVHEKLLRTESSEYFRKLFQYREESSNCNAVDLSHENDSSFRLFNGWLYGGPLLSEDETAPLSNCDL
ncbi:hypothetical protein BCR34DRAFT_558268 [Clohesyomyces aquaticus]|uniref:BTB domain-containing protein n=1 Tax=Clohesyomyces aquaticus TaxID=1231657 RepID=A0A1Y2A0C4_9PLEO|nr:hypothetical protein BCR34DRAFT_558268 [Clohesyomyces aquaticus]